MATCQRPSPVVREPISVAGRIATVRRRPVARWRATTRLALKMAVHSRAKFVGTLLGVVFASLLANFQLGTMFGLLAKNTLFVDNAGADLWIVPPATTFAQPGQRQPTSLLDLARTVPGIHRASALIMVGTSISKPGGGSEAITLVGVDLTLETRGVAKRAARRESEALLERVGLADKLDAYPAQLSGGQRQRVAIARAVAGDPPLVLADEPTAALDAHAGLAVTELLAELARERGATVVIVTHDPRILGFGDRIVRIADGRIVPGNEESS